MGETLTFQPLSQQYNFLANPRSAWYVFLFGPIPLTIQIISTNMHINLQKAYHSQREFSRVHTPHAACRAVTARMTYLCCTCAMNRKHMEQSGCGQ